MTEASIRTAPDGGYGWVVCAVAFIISMVTDGILYSYGVIMPELVKAFQCSASAARAFDASETSSFAGAKCPFWFCCAAFAQCRSSLVATRYLFPKEQVETSSGKERRLGKRMEEIGEG